MVITSTLGTPHIGIICLPQSKEPYHVLQYNTTRLNKSSLFQRLHTRISKRSGHHLYAGRMGFNHAALEQNYQQPSFNDELPPEPFFLSLIKETFWGLRSLLIFLVEQPSQLKYIEWPSFQSTVRS
ncbi:uncharacterized protein LOC101211352 isoform X3 [Cucumis sativus]|uniref:uncharacterized protein LOC101211352 isoform X3 n=1 Tax=Cucumis sativus TaxID=3659 RepID=UPI0005EC4CAF|nr:uncharacterized protein LOC101211352 isoform X3 [Cucumis sativus]